MIKNYYFIFSNVIHYNKYCVWIHEINDKNANYIDFTYIKMQRFQKDFSSIILDEIALEGLDGITIEGKIILG